MKRTAIIPMMNLSEAALWLSEKTGESYSVRDVMYLIDDIAYAVAPESKVVTEKLVYFEGAFNAAKSRTPGAGNGPVFRDDLFKLSLWQLDELRVRRYVRITSYKSNARNLGTGADEEVEFSTNFRITPDDVRVRKSDVELLADAQEANVDRAVDERTTNANESSQPDGEPSMNLGTRNSRDACYAWIQYMAPTMQEKGESFETLCERVIEEANSPLRGYLMAGGKPFSIHIAHSALKPGAMGNEGKPGITGGTKANPGAGRKKTKRE